MHGETTCFIVGLSLATIYMHHETMFMHGEAHVWGSASLFRTCCSKALKALQEPTDANEIKNLLVDSEPIFAAFDFVAEHSAKLNAKYRTILVPIG